MYYVDGAVPLYKFEIFRKFEEVIAHAVSTRNGGVSTGPLESLNLGLQVGDSEENLKENYKRFAAAANIPREKIVIAYQNHTDKVMIIDDSDGQPVDEVDGFMTATIGLPIMVRFADCQGGLFFDPAKKVIAAVHCGWRGNVQNIFGKTVRQMLKSYGCDPSDILVGIGPSLEPEAAEFSDPFNELPVEMHKYVDSQNKVDLWKCSRDQLMTEGVLAENIEIAGLGTYARVADFFSYRYSGGKMGHMGGVIMLK